MLPIPFGLDFDKDERNCPSVNSFRFVMKLNCSSVFAVLCLIFSIMAAPAQKIPQTPEIYKPEDLFYIRAPIRFDSQSS